MSKKHNYELERRVRLSELLRREGELPSEKGAEGAFLLGANRSPAQPISDSVTKDADPKVETSSLTDFPNRESDDYSPDSIAVLPEKSTFPESIRRRHPQQLFVRGTDTPVSRLPGISIYYTNAPTSHSHAPHTFRHFLEHFPVLHKTCIFLHVRTAAQPHVPIPERLVMEASPIWDGIWRGVYRVGYMETPDFTTTEFNSQLFDRLGMPSESLTHVLQYTTLKARRVKEASGEKSLIKRIPEMIRGYAIDVIWSGIDEVIGGIGKGWKVPVGDVVSVGAVAEV